jgi:hypothetical protein
MSAARAPATVAPQGHCPLDGHRGSVPTAAYPARRRKRGQGGGEVRGGKEGSEAGATGEERRGEKQGRCASQGRACVGKIGEEESGGWG